MRCSPSLPCWRYAGFGSWTNSGGPGHQVPAAISPSDLARNLQAPWGECIRIRYSFRRSRRGILRQ